jgi:hypothetical protein
VKKSHVLLLSTLLLAGCGVGTPPTLTPYPLPSTPTSIPGLTPSESPVSPVPLAPKSSGSAQAEVTLYGVVEDGVERGCKILRVGGAVYQLVGSTDPLITAGARLAVRGRPDPNLATTCQQGTPFQVTQVQPDSAS